MGRNKRRSWVSRSSKEIRKRRNVRSGKRLREGVVVGVGEVEAESETE